MFLMLWLRHRTDSYLISDEKLISNLLMILDRFEYYVCTFDHTYLYDNSIYIPIYKDYLQFTIRQFMRILNKI